MEHDMLRLDDGEDGSCKELKFRETLEVLSFWGPDRGDASPAVSWSVLEKEVRPFQPTRGGKQIRNDISQTTKITVLALRGVIIALYWIGFEIAMYLSTEMAQRLRMEAVQIQTSTTSHPWHQISPKIHTSST